MHLTLYFSTWLTKSSRRRQTTRNLKINFLNGFHTNTSLPPHTLKSTHTRAALSMRKSLGKSAISSPITVSKIVFILKIIFPKNKLANVVFKTQICSISRQQFAQCDLRLDKTMQRCDHARIWFKNWKQMILYWKTNKNRRNSLWEMHYLSSSTRWLSLSINRMSRQGIQPPIMDHTLHQIDNPKQADFNCLAPESLGRHLHLI